MQRVAIFGLIDLEVESTAGGTLTLSTDLPGDAMALRETKAIPVTTTRRVVRFRLKGTTKGRLYSVKVSGPGIIRLYAGKIWARVLPGAEWAWYTIPIPVTGDWSATPLPIPPTGEWTPAVLPIPRTADWNPAQLPIPPTADWTPAPLPIKPTPANPEWVDIAVDQ
jgi:hypothetical protein